LRLGERRNPRVAAIEALVRRRVDLAWKNGSSVRVLTLPAAIQRVSTPRQNRVRPDWLADIRPSIRIAAAGTPAEPF
jgi:hypothetical protein